MAYLILGVEPSQQAQGFGRKMLDEKLSELAGAHIPCYLETSEVGNVKYYQRFGFKLIQEYPLMTMTVFCLLRQPEVV